MTHLALYIRFVPFAFQNSPLAELDRAADNFGPKALYGDTFCSSSIPFLRLKQFTLRPCADMATLRVHPFCSLRTPRRGMELAFPASGFASRSLLFAGSQSFFFRSSSRRCRCAPISAKTADYYATLNLSKGATLKEIKSAYRNLARKVNVPRFRSIFVETIFYITMYVSNSKRKKVLFLGLCLDKYRSRATAAQREHWNCNTANTFLLNNPLLNIG